jgi:hypothetical protein
MPQTNNGLLLPAWPFQKVGGSLPVLQMQKRMLPMRNILSANIK